MKILRTFTHISAGVLLTTLGLSAQAATLINNFDNPFDYVANGIIGDTNWDGVYLRAGDIPGGNTGTDGNGNTLVAGTAVGLFSGYLSLQNANGNWAGAADDGFFIYKVVQGDFDMSVESVPGTLTGGSGFDTRGNNFAGLMVRAYNTNNSGGPVSFVSTNATENFLLNWRFQEFSLNQVRQATNNADLQNYNYPDSNSDTNSTRYFRITRTGDAFYFYWKTNQVDAWVLITNNSLYPSGSITRPDWNGRAVQVGIAQAGFNSGTDSRDAFFDDFELSGPNVTFPATMPPASSGLVFSSPNTNGSVKLSWTTNGGDGSLVMIRANGALIANPVQGTTYADNTNFQTAPPLSAANNRIVYVGPATNIIVTGLGGSNNTYSVAVFSYSSSPSPVFNTANPTTNSLFGPGIPVSVTATISPTNIPIGGAGLARVNATFSTGDSYDVSSDPSVTLSSSDSSVLSIANGVMNGITNGTVTVVAGYGGVFTTNTVSVTAPRFTDNFGVTQDYVANGLQGSTWDGLFLNFGDVPGANKGNDGSAGQTFQLIAQTNVLFVQAAGGSWRVAGNDGTFLFKIVNGDFQASAHVTCGTINNNYAGIMARLFNNSKTASQGGGGGANGTETHVNWGNPQQNVPSARSTIDSGGTTVVGGLNTADRWFLMVRQNSTNFLMFEKANATDPWSAVPAATMVLAEATNNAPMEVGLFEEMRAAATDVARFDTVMLDGPGLVSPSNTQPPPPASNLLATVNPDYSITWTWVAATTLGAPAQSMLVMRDGGPVTQQPTYGMGFTIGAGTYPYPSAMCLGDGNYVVFRSANPPASTNNTATITGLIPGHTYYASAYTFAGTFPDRVFAPGISTNKQDGVLLGLITPPIASIPAGGLELATVIGIFSGPTYVDISSAASIVSTNSNVLVTTNNLLTGISNGTMTVAIYVAGSPYTNYVPVAVRAPVFTDNFGVSRDYLNNGVAGSTWDGVYRQGMTSNEIPDSPYVVPGAGWGTSVADANISTNNMLIVTASGDGWEDDNSGGFFLFKYVPGDFEVAVHINSYDIANYNQPGLLARAYSTGTNGTTLGAPFVIGPTRTNANGIVLQTYGESWVSVCRFDEFNFGSYPRLNLDSAVQQSAQPGQGDGNNWLLITRRNGTNFTFYMRPTATSPWQQVPNKVAYQQGEFTGVPMQVGLMAGAWSNPAGTPRTVSFENFMLDRTTGSPLSITQAGASVNITWPPIPGTLQYSLGVSPASWQPVTGVTPVLTSAGYVVTLPITAAPRYFRLVQ